MTGHTRFFLNAPAPTEIYTLSLHDALPILRIAQEEIFGPVATVIPVKSVDEAVEIANGTMYGLSSAIYTRDINKAFRAIRDIRSEEHTSELQSLRHLVCRLLLEKKKKSTRL